MPSVGKSTSILENYKHHIYIPFFKKVEVTIKWLSVKTLEYFSQVRLEQLFEQ